MLKVRANDSQIETKTATQKKNDNPLVIFFLLLLTSVLSFASFATSIDYPISQASMQYNDIQYFVRDKEIKTLQAGDIEFLSLLKEQTSGFAKGTAIIVPEINQSIHKQAAVSGTYDKLTELGWNTLLLTMPSESEPVHGAMSAVPDLATTDTEQAPANATPEQADTESPDDESTAAENAEQNPINMDGVSLNLKAFHQFAHYSEAKLDEVSEEIALRLQAAFELAGTYPGFYLVICQGKSCHWLSELFKSEGFQAPDAMIMLSAHMPDAEQNDRLAVNIAKTEYPVLDLYQDRDNPWVHQTIGERRIMARKNYKTNYRQRKLNSHFDFHGQGDRAIKEIYGFLTAVGM